MGRISSRHRHGPRMRSLRTSGSPRDIWESACGNGAMSHVLGHASRHVISSDLYARGFGEVGKDFLKPTRTADNIVTNPPYNAAEGFVRSGVKHSRQKFALLLRLAFLEGVNRANTIFAKCPPSRVWVFSERITFYPAGVVQKGTGHHSLCVVRLGQERDERDRTEMVQAGLQGALL